MFFLLYLQILKTVKPMILTEEERRQFEEETICHICEKKINPGDAIAIDYDHFTQKYRGKAHGACNLNFRKSFAVQIIFHNAINYDMAFIIKDIASRIEGQISVIPRNISKYFAVIKYVKYTRVRLHFIDSYRFLSESLEKLALYLGNEKKLILKKEFPKPNEAEMFFEKGVVPYEYVDSWDKLAEQTLPRKDDFYSSLTDSHISDGDYLRAQTIWRHFKCKCLLDYYMLYLKSDVLILADICENFRDLMLECYGLDPFAYVSLSSFALDAMLKLTKVKLDLITDIDMLLFFESGIRGGLTQANVRYSKANNKYLSTYDASLPENYLLYFDANSLYPTSMKQKLPTGGFDRLKIFKTLTSRL